MEVILRFIGMVLIYMVGYHIYKKVKDVDK